MGKKYTKEDILALRPISQKGVIIKNKTDVWRRKEAFKRHLYHLINEMPLDLLEEGRPHKVQFVYEWIGDQLQFVADFYDSNNEDECQQ